jgi:truncated hemoglobin YjbI
MSLYDDVGGASGVRTVLDAFYSRALADPVLSRFFLGVDIERLKTSEAHFYATALAAGDASHGRSLEEAHARPRQRGLNTRVFDQFVVVFRRVLVDRGMDARTIGEWLTVLEGARGQILNR